MEATDISPILPILKFMTEKNGSDLFFSTGTPIHVEIEGEILPINAQKMQPGMIRDLAYSIMTPLQIKEFEENLECNFAIGRQSIGRFRVNVFKQRGEVGMVVRHIKTEIPTIDKLGLPPILNNLIMRKRGLILIVGATGSGKTTSLAAMIDFRNANATGHIVTVEDPIEYMYTHKKSVVDQREVGIDTLSFENALKNAMRQAPDVILIGEIRDMEGMKNALAYAETGHLCLATLHANNANQALERIISFFPENDRNGLLLNVAMNLVAIVSQRLVPGTLSKREPAVEVMINTPYISELIQKQKMGEIKTMMADSNDIGMITFDQSLFKLFSAGRIDEESALAHADSRNDLSLKIRFAAEANRNVSSSFGEIG